MQTGCSTKYARLFFDAWAQQMLNDAYRNPEKIAASVTKITDIRINPV